ncbi:MAG: undecaprenyl-phosphate glucose phosphotransferase [Lachnospiraceae bacterium]|nr:undecaprenyl-phosphate glucose phosphotransferase [Lachnospiraceae bacterium]
MKKDKQTLVNTVHVILDILMIMLAYALSYVIKFVIKKDPLLFDWRPSDWVAIEYYARPIPFVILGFLIIYTFCGLYSQKRIIGRRRELSRMFVANIIGILVFVTLLYFFKKSYWFSGEFIFYFGILNTLFLVIERVLIRKMLSGIRKKGFNQKHILLVGCSHSADDFAKRVRENPQWGYNIRGILDDKRAIGSFYSELPILGRTSELAEYLEKNQFDEVMITLPLSQYDRLKEVVAATEKEGIHTKFIPDYSDVIPSSPYTEDLLGLPVINIRHVPLMDGPNRFVKRAFDIIFGSICLIVFSIPMIICAILVKCTSKGPVLFKQERVGLHNRPFTMYKFRSMTVQTDEEEKDKWTTKNDTRVTGVGSFMRKTSLDELPQLFNVIKGEMSLIGPRPERPFFVEKFKEEIPRYMVKHQVRPGMTGWAQVNGFRGDTSIRKRIDCDLYYIENWTFGFDIRILFLTVFKGFVNKNAY